MNGNKTPSLDDLIMNPSGVATLPPEAAQLLLIQVASIHSLLVQRVLMGNHNGQANNGLLLTVRETAARLKLSPYRTYELIRQGKLKRVPIGKTIRVKGSDLDEFISTQGR